MLALEQIKVSVATRALSLRLAAHGFETPQLEARVLMGIVLGKSSGQVMLCGDENLGVKAQADLEALVRRRMNGEPVARLISRREFWGLDFDLVATSLIPRPDSETVIVAALALFAQRGAPPSTLLDLGTGPGTLLLSLLHEWPQARGIGVDIDEATLQAARGNARRLDQEGRLGDSTRALFIRGDWGAGMAHSSFDLIVANPPYIRSAEIESLDIEVRCHDPLRALDGGPDGLAAYRSLLPQAAHLLKGDGVLIVEIGEDQSEEVTSLARESGFEVEPAPQRDLAGRPRVIVGRLPEL